VDAKTQDVSWQVAAIDRAARVAMNSHGPAVIWFTGISGAGKSTISDLVERRLHELGVRTYLLDGDNLRHGLNRDLGFSHEDRVENIRRVAEVAALMADAGLVVLVGLISPFRKDRDLARERSAGVEFCEVFVDTPLEIAERRDTKGLYVRARRGELRDFTGIDSPYEPPERAEVHIQTATTEPEEAARAVVEHLRRAGVLEPR